MKLVRGGTGVTVLSLSEAQAQKRAEEILARAHTEAEDIRAKAYAEAMAMRLLATTETARMEAWVTDLACAVAASVLGREAEGGTAVVRDVTRRVLDRVRRAHTVRVSVAPEEAERVKTEIAGWLPEGMAPEVLEVVSDDAVSRGGVVLESELGRVDGRLDVQLAAIAYALTRSVGEGP